MIEYVCVGREHPVGNPVLPEILPDVLDRVQFGAFAGSGSKVMLGGTFSLRETCQPAWSSNNTAWLPGVTACAISARCRVMASVVQRGSTRPAALPCAGQIAPKM